MYFSKREKTDYTSLKIIMCMNIYPEQEAVGRAVPTCTYVAA
jgi:hypothetical protein